jgi:NADPH-dependent 2,4-dienoyl-CoA reductase/sulfur reductase-like enzyme
MMRRRDLLRRGAGAALAAALPRLAVAQGESGHVVVIGGGFAGASCARALKRLNPRLAVTLVEPGAVFTACPFSNEVVAGLRDLKEQQFTYDGVRGDGVVVAKTRAVGVDPKAQAVTVADNTRLTYDRLVVAPGIDFRWDALPGYDEAAAGRMPHAWKAGAQTLLLRDQLAAMHDGGLVVISAPANPYRCPPGPYERASLIAHFLKQHKPKSKLLILDAKDAFSKQKLFEAAWAALYPGIIEWVPLSQGGKVTSVDPAGLGFVTDFSTHRADVANVIPPQQAGHIAGLAGVADRTGWCPVDPASFASTLQPNIHVVGDAAIAGAMPKSAFAANAQAKVCAAAIVAQLGGGTAPAAKLINTCYSLVAPDYGISVVAVYHPEGGQLVEIPGTGGTSPLDAPAATRAREASLADGWFHTITGEAFG